MAVVPQEAPLVAAGDQVVVSEACDLNAQWTGRTGTVLKVVDDGKTVFPIATVSFPATDTQPEAEAEFNDVELQVVTVQEPAPATAPEPAQEAVAYHGEVLQAATADEVRTIPLTDIVVTRNTRKTFDEAGLQRLADSIKGHGLIHPVMVRPYPTEPGKYNLVVGGRRYRASQLAGVDTIRATVRELTDQQFLEIQLLENHAREDVNPADEAEDFAEAIGAGMLVQEIALRLGMRPEFVAQRAQLVQLIPPFMDMLRAGRMHIGAAVQLARQTQEIQERIAKEEKYALTNLTVVLAGHAQGWVDRYLRELASAPFSKKCAELLPAAGPCTACPKRTAAQEFLFADLAQKDRCLDAGCFAAKLQAHIDTQVAQLTADLQQKPLLISNQYTPSKPGLLSSQGYQKVSADTPGAVRAVVVDSYTIGDLGTQVYIKLAKDAKDPEQSRKEREATILANKVKARHKLLLADALVEHLLDTQNDWPALLRYLAKDLLSYNGKPSEVSRQWLEKHFGFTLPGKLEGHQDVSTWLDESLARLSTVQLSALLLTYRLHRDSLLDYSDAVVHAAAGAGVDVEELRKQAQLQVTAAKAKPKKAGKEVAAA
ncbi:ParB/RepB/Spo0J family partition protein [Hymenobacter sp. B81]|uniref:ParB/RepB/Spo0J family partition protein n=1 Tax=Hymenobacter sp. B81 TaxID=3344878 RepID=UPI0037DDBAC6